MGLVNDDLYIMDENHNVIPEPDIRKWGEWMEKNHFNRQIKREELLPGVVVSTVFLGMDHSFPAGKPPILFESMVFGGDADQYQRRCSTYEEALQMHEDMKWYALLHAPGDDD